MKVNERLRPILFAHSTPGPRPDPDLIEKRLNALLAGRHGERKSAMSKKETIPSGTHNVLVNLGFDDAEKLSAKATLAVKLNELIDKRRLSQTSAAAITGVTRSNLSLIRRYKLQTISLERLMEALVTLDQHIEIVVQAARRTHRAGITVAA